MFFANKIYFLRTRGVFLHTTSLVLNIDLQYSLQWFNITNTVGEGFPLPIYPTNKSFATANCFKHCRGGYHPPVSRREQATRPTTKLFCIDKVDGNMRTTTGRPYVTKTIQKNAPQIQLKCIL